jgi:hypothetical protein
MPRYNFEEKLEYWAFVWGTLIMVITGFMLWNPIATTKFLPGSFIPAAKAAHGGEALLAVLAIIVWHFYGVHLRKFNRSMFTGKISRDDMAHEHALELEEIETGGRVESPPEEIARRRRIFIPVGTVITILLLAGIYWFVTLEETAISTVEAAPSTVEVFQPLTLEAGGNIHSTIQEYTGPETCASTGCHNGEVIDKVVNSDHARRIAAAGPDPLLALTVDASALATKGEGNCLVCHARDYNPDDMLASAHTIGPSGGSDCARCHTTVHPENSVHNGVGLACVSCHASLGHEIEPTAAGCTSCHAEQPHPDPLINSKHGRLDCRTCHVSTDVAEMIADTGKAVSDPATGYYRATLEAVTGAGQFVWQNGTVTDDAAKIVPVVPLTIMAPANLDPVDFASSGSVSGNMQETVVEIHPSHDVSKTSVRTCDSCHGPEATFDFAALGYEEARADQLSAKAADATE